MDANQADDFDERVRTNQRSLATDGSIMPRVTSGNTNAPVLAIADRAVDLIPT